jgi:hypothetical protein
MASELSRLSTGVLVRTHKKMREDAVSQQHDIPTIVALNVVIVMVEDELARRNALAKERWSVFKRITNRLRAIIATPEATDAK